MRTLPLTSGCHNRQLRAVNAISRSQWNDGYGANPGPSRGDPCRRASRPIEASKAAVCYVRNTSIRDVRLLGTSVARQVELTRGFSRPPRPGRPLRIACCRHEAKRRPHAGSSRGGDCVARARHEIMRADRDQLGPEMDFETPNPWLDLDSLAGVHATLFGSAAQPHQSQRTGRVKYPCGHDSDILPVCAPLNGQAQLRRAMVTVAVKTARSD